MFHEKEMTAFRSLGLALTADFSTPKATVRLRPYLAEATHHFTVQAWRFENGRPENRVEAVLPASDGNLWVGGPSGLARFDGVRFTTFTPANCPWLSPPVC